MVVLDELYKLQDVEYADFQAKLTPTVAREKFIGVRVPQINKLAKEFKKDSQHKSFMSELPHYYFEENMLQGKLIANTKDFDLCLDEIERFLPFIDNWAVCDSMCPKALKGNKKELLKRIKKWAKSKETYTLRFAVLMLMDFYLDEDFKAEYLQIPANIKSDEYYVKMVVAWYFATALAKQWNETITYIENQKLDKWIHNKAIQKAVESYRITPEQKLYLKSLRIK